MDRGWQGKCYEGGDMPIFKRFKRENYHDRVEVGEDGGEIEVVEQVPHLNLILDWKRNEKVEIDIKKEGEEVKEN